MNAVRAASTKLLPVPESPHNHDQLQYESFDTMGVLRRVFGKTSLRATN